VDLWYNAILTLESLAMSTEDGVLSSNSKAARGGLGEILFGNKKRGAS
jgi:hypothetical protein